MLQDEAGVKPCVTSRFADPFPARLIGGALGFFSQPAKVASAAPEPFDHEIELSVGQVDADQI